MSNCYFRLINLYVYSVDESSICRFSFERGSNELDRFIPRPTEAGIWGSTTAAAFVVLPDLVQFSLFHARERNQIKTFFFPTVSFCRFFVKLAKIKKEPFASSTIQNCFKLLFMLTFNICTFSTFLGFLNLMNTIHWVW